jgi:hypothetical protein
MGTLRRVSPQRGWAEKRNHAANSSLLGNRRSFDYASRDKATRGFAEDDTLMGWWVDFV